MQLVIERDGVVRCVYDETLDLHMIGRVTIRRGSHVEPDAAGRWWADLSPAGGPVLGPFGLRSEALAAERRWLEEHWVTRDSTQASGNRGGKTIQDDPAPSGP